MNANPRAKAEAINQILEADWKIRLADTNCLVMLPNNAKSLKSTHFRHKNCDDIPVFITSYDMESEGGSIWDSPLYGEMPYRAIVGTEIYMTEAPLYLRFEYDGENIGELHPRFQKIYNSLEESKYILELKEDFDEEGSIPYRKETVVSVWKFLISNAKSLFEKSARVLPAPKIYHGPEQSIDVVWKDERHKCLLNIPANAQTFTFSITGLQSFLNIYGEVDFAESEEPLNLIISLFDV